MTDPVDLYRRAAHGAIAVAMTVEPHELGLATPCSEWTVQDVLDHLGDGTRYLGAAIIGGVPTPPSATTVDDLRFGIETCLDGLADPEMLDRTCMSPLGFEWTVGQAAAGTSMDLLVHTWDIATAIGRQADLDSQVVEACVAMFLPHMPEAGRAAGIVGPAVDVGPDATPQQRLLAAMGRHP